MTHEKKSPYTFLPGGHVGIGESVIATIERELQEEIGLSCTVNEYLGAVEHSWFHDGIHNFENNHLFKASLKGIEPLVNPESKEPHLEFYWIPISDLEKHNIQPYPLLKMIKISSDIIGAWWGSSLR